MNRMINEIENCCEASSKATSTYSSMPWLCVEAAHVYATNGMVLAIVPCEIHPEDTSGPLPIEALKRARKALSTFDTSTLIARRTQVTFSDGATIPRTDNPEASGISYEPGIKLLENSRNAAGGREPDLCIDASLLLRLAKALNDTKDRSQSGRIKLWFARSDEGAFDFRAVLYAKAFGSACESEGLIMPLRA